MKRHLLIFAICFITVSFGQPQITFHADSLHGTLGDLIPFAWEVEHGDQITLDLGELDLENTGIELLDYSISRTESGSMVEMETAIYDSVGIYQFPPVDLILSSTQGNDTLRIPGPPLQIISILTASDTTFRDIKDLHRVRIPISPWVFLWVILILVAAYLIYRLVRHLSALSEEESTDAITPPEEAHIVAFEALETLSNSQFLKGKKYKAFYSELTYILKQYYENRFLIDTLECTTTELMDKMESISDFDSATKSKTAGLLNTADLIKFAKATSTTAESKKNYDTVYQIVDTTKLIIQDDSPE